MSDQLVPVPLADSNVRRLFDEPEFEVTKRGYDPEGVARFLDELGSRTITLIQRLRSAETDAKTARVELDDYRVRTQQAESSRELFQRTLSLAEETANASIADAQARAHRLEADAERDSRRMVDETRLRVERMMDAARADVQRAYAEDRQAIAEAQRRIADESDQLETLRLAVAAETMALEEVRNEMRRRIRRAATDLLGVAESPDCLGTPVTRGIPEVVARQTAALIEQEAEVPDAPSPAPEAAAVSPGSLGQLPPPVVPAAVPVEPTTETDTATEPGTDTEASEARFVIDADPTVPIDLSEVERAADESDVEAEAADPETAGTVDDADAFDRFMSKDIEDEPSRNWILA